MKVIDWRAAVAALMLWAATSAGQIASPPPQSNPLEPSPAGPEGVVRADPALSVLLQWRQEEFSPANTNAPARHFLLCVYVPDTSDCASTPLRWMQSATTIQRAPVTRPSVSGPPFVMAYDYTFPIVLPPEMIDRQVEWRVGACSSALESSCTFATRAVWFSTYNLAAVNISAAASTSTMLWVTGEVRNDGLAASGAFETSLDVYEAVADEYGRCITNVNAEGVDADRGFAVTSKGELVELGTLPRDANGHLDARRYAVVAILNGHTYVGSSIAMHAGLAVAASATVVEFNLDLSNYRLPAAFATRLYADTDNNVRMEYDERDNRKGECHTIFAEAPPPSDATLTVQIVNGAADRVVDSQPVGINCNGDAASDCTETFAPGAKVVLWATRPGFQSWRGCDQVDIHRCAVTMNQSRTVTATYSP